MKRILNILIFSFAFFAFLVPAGVFAIPAFPMNFWGNVTINGENAPIGSVVGAYNASNALVAQFTVTTAGLYGSEDRTVLGSAKLSVPDYSGAGAGLTLKMNSPSYNDNVILADTESYAGAFQTENHQNQNLAFTGAIPNTAVTAIAVTPTTASVAVYNNQQFTATATYYDATTADITTSCTWTSSSISAATIGTNTGLATGVSAGSPTITASYTDADYGVLTDTAILTVTGGGTAAPSGGGGGGTAPSVPTTTNGDVTATYSGGANTTLTTADNTKITVKFLPYAVATGTKISVDAVSKTAAKVSSAVFAVVSGKSIVGSYVYEFSAEKGGEAVTEFSKKATITLTYTAAQIKGLKESTLTISYWDADNEVWVALDTTVNKTSKKLTAKTSHFSYFAIMGEEGVDAPVITRAYIREQMKNIIKQLIVLITELIKVYQVELLELRALEE